MHPHPDSLLLLADIRYHELQNEAARTRLVREAYGNGPPLSSVVVAMGSRLGLALTRAAELLRDTRHAHVSVRRDAKAA